MKHSAARGFTLVEVLVALMIVAMGLAALMTAVSGTARATGLLRDKTLAQWIALNRLSEVRLNLNKMGDSHDTGQVDFANRQWHYDTRYFDTSINTVKRVVVRVWAGDAATKGNPVAEATGFLGATLATPGSSNVDWTVGPVATTAAQGAAGTTGITTTPSGAGTPLTTTSPSGSGTSPITTTPLQ